MEEMRRPTEITWTVQSSRGGVHVPAAECYTGIHRGYPGHVTAYYFPLPGGPGAVREIGTGGVRAVRGRCHRDREGSGCPGRRHSDALLVLRRAPGTLE